MKMSWLIGITSLFIVLSLISGVIEGVYLGGAEDTQTVLESLFSPATPSTTTLLGIDVTALAATWNWFTALFGLLFFDYAFFDGEWQIIRWIIFIPVGLATVISIVLALVRGVSSE